MAALLIGYARVSTDTQDLTSQREGLVALGVDAARIYVDHGLTGTNRERPGLREALAACREGDTLVVTKLDRLARSLPDARAIAEELTLRHVRLSLGGSVYDPHDPVGRLLFNVLAMVAEFEADLIRLRTREGMQVAKAKGKLRGKQPKLNLARKRTSSVSTGRVSTAQPNSPICSASPARPSTARWNGSGNAPPSQLTSALPPLLPTPGADVRRRGRGCPAGGTAAGQPRPRTFPAALDRCGVPLAGGDKQYHEGRADEAADRRHGQSGGPTGQFECTPHREAV